MKTQGATVGWCLTAAVVIGPLAAAPLQGQLWERAEFPLAPTNSAGNIVAPYFDGWFENEDGTFTLVFGFMNRNEDGFIEIPLGPDNFIEPAQYDGVQPTYFPTVSAGGIFGGPRERGAFGVVVPADFRGDVWWHLHTGDYETQVPGRLVSPGTVIRGAYELSTMGQADGSKRPYVWFEPGGPRGFGPAGSFHPETFETTVGVPISVTVYGEDNFEGREAEPLQITWKKHQGPVGGEVTFEAAIEMPADSAAAAELMEDPPDPTDEWELPFEGPDANQGTVLASFSMPGEYVIRGRVDNFNAGDSSFSNQCCWTNAFVRVTVTE